MSTANVANQAIAHCIGRAILIGRAVANGAMQTDTRPEQRLMACEILFDMTHNWPGLLERPHSGRLSRVADDISHAKRRLLGPNGCITEKACADWIASEFNDLQNRLTVLDS